MIKNYEQLVNYLIDKNITISTAESCTGGLIGKNITDIAGSSNVYIGGVISYSNEMKMNWLKVHHKTLENYGAVSNETVSEMLTGITHETNSDIAVAVSGIAGPGGGTKEKPVGTVIIGISFKGNQHIKKYYFTGTRDSVRLNAAEKVLDMIDDIVVK